MLRTLEGRAQLTVVALWVAAVASIADAYAHVNRLRIVQDAVNTQVGDVAIAVPDSVIGRADDYVTITLVLSVVCLLAVAALWLPWQHAAHRRLADRLDGRVAEPRSGLLAWVVPGVNLLAPPLVLAALLRAAGRRAAALLAGWWVAWLAAIALAVVGTANPDSLADQRLPDGLAMIGDILALAAAVAAIGVVRALTEVAAAAQPGEDRRI